MSHDIHSQKILVIDFDSPFTQLVARKVREAGVYTEVLPWDIETEKIAAFNPNGVILSGGSGSVTQAQAASIPQAVFDFNVPVLGIGFGFAALVKEQGGSVKNIGNEAYQTTELSVSKAEGLLAGVNNSKVWTQLVDVVEALPAGFEVLAQLASGEIAAAQNLEKQLYGVQFHPEVEQSESGAKILENFALNICGCQVLWTSTNIIEHQIAKVREQVGKQKVLLGLSGGVDSSVVAALLHKAIGDQLTCVFVDHGLLRKDEGNMVMEMFADNMGVKVIRVDAEDLFLGKLAGETDPEVKRKIIGNTFIEVFDAESSKLQDVPFLAQGTIYPDIIESVNAKGKVIKSHHNVGGLPEDMKMELVEPLRQLFKDEVRKIGVELGLPAEMVYRHPFPGPGLGVRILGEIKKEYADILREADAIFIEELRNAGWYDKTAQAFAVFVPQKSVGVVNDERRYEWVVSLRAVETVDFMTARWAHLPYELLEKVSSRIINEIEHISRVAYDISSKPPATIEWE